MHTLIGRIVDNPGLILPVVTFLEQCATSAIGKGLISKPKDARRFSNHPIVLPENQLEQTWTTSPNTGAQTVSAVTAVIENYRSTAID